jgi:hypothetical protein
MDGKNTLQSFDAVQPNVDPLAASNDFGHSVIGTAELIVVPPNDHATININNNNDNDEPNHIDDNVVHAEAVAVVDADIADSQVEPSRSHSKQRNYYRLALIIVIAVVAIGIGTFCSTGNCSSNSTRQRCPQQCLQLLLDPHHQYQCHQLLLDPHHQYQQRLRLLSSNSKSLLPVIF